MNRLAYPADQGFIQQFCAHAMTRYGLCIGCGAVVTPGMFDHIKEFRPGDCPWCAFAEPDSVFSGSPVDWHCLKMSESCSLIRGGEREGMDCPCYWPRKVDLK